MPSGPSSWRPTRRSFLTSRRSVGLSTAAYNGILFPRTISTSSGTRSLVIRLFVRIGFAVLSRSRNLRGAGPERKNSISTVFLVLTAPTHPRSLQERIESDPVMDAVLYHRRKPTVPDIPQCHRSHRGCKPRTPGLKFQIPLQSRRHPGLKERQSFHYGEPRVRRRHQRQVLRRRVPNDRSAVAP